MEKHHSNSKRVYTYLRKYIYYFILYTHEERKEKKIRKGGIPFPKYQDAFKIWVTDMRPFSCVDENGRFMV